MKDFKYSIMSIAGGVIANGLTVYIQETKYMDWDLFILILYCFLMVALGMFAFFDYRRTSKDISIDRIKHLASVLHRFASNKDQFSTITTDGVEVVGGHAGNFTWKEIASHICEALELKHLIFSNLGTQYRLIDVNSGDVFDFPTDRNIEEPIEKSGIKNGQILLLEKIT